MTKEDATEQAVESSMERLPDISRGQSEIISVQARTIKGFRGMVVELSASLA